MEPCLFLGSAGGSSIIFDESSPLTAFVTLPLLFTRSAARSILLAIRNRAPRWGSELSTGGMRCLAFPVQRRGRAAFINDDQSCPRPALVWHILVSGGGCSFRVANQCPRVGWTAPITGSAIPLITQAIDESQRVTLRGSLHPLAQARFDQGAVPDSFAANRLLLVLNRPPGREAALKQFLTDVHTQGSASFHKWLTPEQFGALYGPADSDMEAARSWLTSHGFRVSRATAGKRFIEFSGSAANVREAFHTEIHRYDIKVRLTSRTRASSPYPRRSPRLCAASRRSTTSTRNPRSRDRRGFLHAFDAPNRSDVHQSRRPH